MGVQFEHLTLAPHQSLSFLMEDVVRARRDGLFVASDTNDLHDWLNVLKHWSAPLVSSIGHRSLEQWLDTVDASTESVR